MTIRPFLTGLGLLSAVPALFAGGEVSFGPPDVITASALGAQAVTVADVDGDGDLDVVVVSAYNNWDDPSAMSLVWLENNGQLQFAMHRIASSPTHLITLATGDLDGDGTIDLVTGGMHISRPYDRLSRVTVWSNHKN